MLIKLSEIVLIFCPYNPNKLAFALEIDGASFTDLTVI